MEVCPEKPPLQLELESFGITAARARALVEAHSEAHIRSRIDYVRGLMEHRPARVGGAGATGRRTTVKNPAGLLSRAIEQSYVIPEPAQPARPATPAAPVPPPRSSGIAQPEAQSMRMAAQASPVPIANDLAAVARGLVPRPDSHLPTAADVPTQLAPYHPAVSNTQHLTPNTQSSIPSPQSSVLGIQATSPADCSPDHPLWSRLAAALKDRLSPATYAAWIAPARPLLPSTAGPDKPDQGNQPQNALTLVLPSAFALDRWHRPPIAPALHEAAAEAGIAVTLIPSQPEDGGRRLPLADAPTPAT